MSHHYALFDASNAQRAQVLVSSIAGVQTCVSVAGRAEAMNVALQNLCAQQNLRTADLSAFACVLGPGSYTGLRVALAACKAWCYALEKPLIGVHFLELMACVGRKHTARISSLPTTIVPVLRAREGEFFCAKYDAKTGDETLAPQLICLNEKRQLVALSTEEKKLYVVKEDYFHEIKNHLHERDSYIFFDDYSNCDFLSCVSALVSWRIKNKIFEDIFLVRPMYLKAPFVGQAKNPFI